MFCGAKARARKNGLEFDLTLEDTYIPLVCPILGIPLKQRGDGRGASFDSPTLDRINSSLGYVKGNVAVISRKANSLKSNGTIEDFEKIVHYMKTRNGIESTIESDQKEAGFYAEMQASLQL